MKKTWKIIIGCLVVLLLVGGVLVALAVRDSLETVRDSYAQWDAALALIHHMKTHGGAWPKGWTELEESYNTTPGLRGPVGWGNLKARVDVEFTADPQELRMASPQGDEPPFNVVWLRNGRTSHWGGAEPNALILKHLNEVKPDRVPADVDGAVQAAGRRQPWSLSVPENAGVRHGGLAGRRVVYTMARKSVPADEVPDTSGAVPIGLPEDDRAFPIAEAAVRYMFKHAEDWGGGYRAVRFVSLAWKPAPQAFVDRFADSSPPVRGMAGWSRDPLLTSLLRQHRREGEVILEETEAVLVLERPGSRARLQPQPWDFGGLEFGVDKIAVRGSDLAVAECHVMLHGLGARGYTIYLKHGDGQWTVLVGTETWIS